MALIDIPTRDSLDGAAQLVRLRSYLKDPSTGSERFTDDFLIALLVIKSSFEVWRQLLNIPELSEQEVEDKKDPVVPWSYDIDNPSGPVNTIRALISDISETSLQYTDYDLNKLLDVMPLRRLVQAIKANDIAGSTIPADSYHPLTVARELLGDTGPSFSYTDQQILGGMLSRYLSPYGYVLEIVSISLGRSSVSQSTSLGGEFAAIDGISFSADKITSSGSLQHPQATVDGIYNSFRASEYYKDLHYNFYICGEPSSSEVNGGWYAV